MPLPNSPVFTITKPLNPGYIYWVAFNWMTTWKKQFPGVTFVVTMSRDNTKLRVYVGNESRVLTQEEYVCFVGEGAVDTTQQLRPYLFLLAGS